ncbi:MAG: aminotransferase class I/II-fold pyridoxal phosphate-dependent enzyme [Lachnospiraceae bacterium]|nr:aminotransferase class I/II-fold pyridoxal phosphate-dependent enzyme [Lachnospiraceae bacterium]
MMSNGFHGSDTQAVADRYGIREEDIIQFSANVNPLGLSERFRQSMAENIDCITEYPERDYRTLRNALSQYTGVIPSHIIPGNGSTEIISAFIRSFEHCNALIVSPAYAEYERNVKAAGGRASYFELDEKDNFNIDAGCLADAVDDNTDIVVICNPVNPTSTALAKDEMGIVLEKCDKCGAFVLVDETYVEFSDIGKYSCAGLVEEWENLFVIRSMSKFFSCPGLRLGYGMTENEDILKKIEEKKDPWSVSSFAEKAAVLLLSDAEHIRTSKTYIEEERARVCRLLDELKANGLKYYSPCANFVLCRIEDEKKNATGLFEQCIRKNMMIRDCTGYGSLDKRYFRFCFMDRENDDALLKEIKDYLTG